MDSMDFNSKTEEYEKLVCRMILDYAKEFYKKPENQRAFEDWLARRNESQPGSEQQYGEQ